MTKPLRAYPLIIGNGGHAKVIKSFYDGPDGIVALGNNADRKRLVDECIAAGWWTNGAAIHPSAIVDKSARIGIGTVIMAGAIVQADVTIGSHCILNTGCSVDHDCVLEDFVHIAPGAHLCGGVHVGEGALVGVGVGIAPCAVIPAWSLCKAARLDICPMK